MSGDGSIVCTLWKSYRTLLSPCPCLQQALPISETTELPGYHSPRNTRDIQKPHYKISHLHPVHREGPPVPYNLVLPTRASQRLLCEPDHLERTLVALLRPGLKRLIELRTHLWRRMMRALASVRRQNGAEEDRVAQTKVHALPARRRVLVRRVADENDHPAGRVRRRAQADEGRRGDGGVHRKTRRPDRLGDLERGGAFARGEWD